MFTCIRWLCDPIWQVTLRSCAMSCCGKLCTLLTSCLNITCHVTLWRCFSWQPLWETWPTSVEQGSIFSHSAQWLNSAGQCHCWLVIRTSCWIFHASSGYIVMLLYLWLKCAAVIGSNRITWCKLIWGIDRLTGSHRSIPRSRDRGIDWSRYWPVKMVFINTR